VFPQRNANLVGSNWSTFHYLDRDLLPRLFSTHLKKSNPGFLQIKTEIKFRSVGFSHGLRPWKYLRDGGVINQ
jgi:hypothetical protein